MQGRSHDVDVRYIFACTFMGNGHLVLACGTYGLKVLDKNVRVVAHLALLTCRNLCALNDHEVLVTKGSDKQLQYIRILPDIKLGSIIHMNRNCYGVDAHGDVIYVTCHNAPGQGEIRALNRHGDLLRTIGVDNGEYLFQQPDYIKVNRSGDKLFVSDAETNIVTCLNSQGRPLYRYSNEYELQNPKGMFVDENDSLYVCGHKSNTIHIISTEGKLVKELLTKKCEVENPLCLAFRQTDKLLAVGLLGRDRSLLTFHHHP